MVYCYRRVALVFIVPENSVAVWSERYAIAISERGRRGNELNRRLLKEHSEVIVMMLALRALVLQQHRTISTGGIVWTKMLAFHVKTITQHIGGRLWKWVTVYKTTEFELYVLLLLLGCEQMKAPGSPFQQVSITELAPQETVVEEDQSTDPLFEDPQEEIIVVGAEEEPSVPEPTVAAPVEEEVVESTEPTTPEIETETELADEPVAFRRPARIRTVGCQR